MRVNEGLESVISIISWTQSNILPFFQCNVHLSLLHAACLLGLLFLCKHVHHCFTSLPPQNIQLSSNPDRRKQREIKSIHKFITWHSIGSVVHKNPPKHISSILRVRGGCEQFIWTMGTKCLWPIQRRTAVQSSGSTPQHQFYLNLLPCCNVSKLPASQDLDESEEWWSCVCVCVREPVWVCVWCSLWQSVVAALEKALSFKHWGKGLRGAASWLRLGWKALTRVSQEGPPLLPQSSSTKLPLELHELWRFARPPRVISQSRPPENTDSAMREYDSSERNK